MKRSDDKDVYPGFWEASAGGSALSGEEPLEAATRELLEETGLVPDSMELVNVLFKDPSRAMFYSYLARVSCDKDSVTLQEGETVAYKWLDKEVMEHRFFKKNELPENLNEYDKRIILEWAERQ